MGAVDKNDQIARLNTRAGLAGRLARGSRMCALAGVPRPAPRVAAAYVRAGRRARARARLGGRGRARWLARPGPRPGSRPRTCALAGGPAPVPGAGVADRRGKLEDGRGGECAQTGDSNAGCNYPVRGYSPSMHFFWGGDMPRYSPPLHFGRGRAGCRASRQPVLPF